MKYKSALQLFIDPILETPKDRRLFKSNTDATRRQYVELVSKANKSVKIVAGEANRQLFDREDFAIGLDTFLQNNPDSELQFIFHKDDDINIAKELFEEQNKSIVALKKQFSDRIHIFWIDKRPHQHYAVIDNGELAILEEPDHKPNEPFDALITQDKQWARKWSKRFDNYLYQCLDLGHCQELVFDV